MVATCVCSCSRSALLLKGRSEPCRVGAAQRGECQKALECVAQQGKCACVVWIAWLRREEPVSCKILRHDFEIVGWDSLSVLAAHDEIALDQARRQALWGCAAPYVDRAPGPPPLDSARRANAEQEGGRRP